MVFSELGRVRKRKGYSQEEMAKRLGIHRNSYGRIEKTLEATESQKAIIASILNTPVSEIFSFSRKYSKTLARRNNGQVNQSGAPYNDLYQATSALFNRICEPLPIRRDQLECYCQMPEAQNQLKNTIENNHSGITILSGEKGIGKSSLTVYLSEIYNNKDQYLAIRLDIGKISRYQLTSQSSGTDSQRSEPFLDFFTKSLHVEVKETLGQNRLMTPEFFFFLEKNSSPLIYPEAEFITSDEDRVQILEKICATGYYPDIIYETIHYLAVRKKACRIVLFIDNLNVYNRPFIDEILRRTIEFVSITSGYKHIQSSRLVISTQSSIANSLVKQVTEIGLDSTDFKLVTVNRAPSINDILSGNIEREPVASPRMAIPVGQNGKTYTLDKILGFARQIVSEFRENGYGDIILSLCGQNVKKALQITLSIIRNRYFIDPYLFLDRGASVIEGQSIVSWSSFLKCLAYANPINDRTLFYPCESTIIPNIFMNLPEARRNILAGFRVIQFLHANNFTLENHQATTVDSLRTYLTDTLMYGERDSEFVLVELWRRQLVRTTDQKAPGLHQKDDQAIFLSHRAACLISLMSEQGYLIEFFAEDTNCPVEILIDPGKRLLELPPAGRVDQIIAFLEYILNQEINQVETLTTAGDLITFIRQTRHWCVSQSCLNGVKSLIQNHYMINPDIRHRKIKSWEIRLREIQKRITTLITSSETEYNRQVTNL